MWTTAFEHVHHTAAAHQHEIDAIGLGVRRRIVGQPIEAADGKKASVHL